MKICRIVYEMPPPWDGLTPHPYEITVAQAKNGHEITVFCGRWPNSGKSEQIPGVKYHYAIREPFPATVSLTSSILIFFSYLWWRRKNTPDIIHSHGHFGIWIFFWRNLLRKFLPWSEELSIPLVAHFHNTAKGRWDKLASEGKYIAPHSKFLQWPLSVFSDKQAVKAATVCIFVSSDTKDEALKHYGAETSRCFVVETGVNTRLFTAVGQPEKERSRKDSGLDLFDKVIVNVGAMVERKNILLLVQALKHLPEQYKLVLVGNWDTSYQQVVLKEAENSGVTERLVKVGYTPYPLTPIAYQIADVFVLPSSWEGLPKAVMEALSCGVPSIVSGFKIDTPIQGLIYLQDLDPANIAQKIVEVVEGHVKVDTQIIYQKYSWQERVKEIEKVYEFAKNITV